MQGCKALCFWLCLLNHITISIKVKKMVIDQQCPCRMVNTRSDWLWFSFPPRLFSEEHCYLLKPWRVCRKRSCRWHLTPYWVVRLQPDLCPGSTIKFRHEELLLLLSIHRDGAFSSSNHVFLTKRNVVADCCFLSTPFEPDIRTELASAKWSIAAMSPFIFLKCTIFIMHLKFADLFEKTSAKSLVVRGRTRHQNRRKILAFAKYNTDSLYIVCVA